MQHTFYCNKCNDDFSIYIEDYYPADELLEIMLQISAMELEKAWVHGVNGLLYCGSCKPKGAKIYEFKNYYSKDRYKLR
ncbi:hypothetical protein [Heyndrickxia camelliae]|uniref:Uncharacterized protein n=1 Tax=Heyndrickxia camelliae TaxID=1707093 RepID=A0A2N3LGZ0_9BACI|nr:hypothetical protein [Heyndrickxia camelliae]PKR83898.1 hypothetical protein CWO92_16710 [Heyndrickxia camelliae]